MSPGYHLTSPHLHPCTHLAGLGRCELRPVSIQSYTGKRYRWLLSVLGFLTRCNSVPSVGRDVPAAHPVHSPIPK